MQLQLLEREAHQHDDGLGDVALTSAIAVDPVPDRRTLQCAARHVVQVDFAGQLVVDEHAEWVGVVGRPFPITRRAASVEGAAVAGRVGHACRT